MAENGPPSVSVVIPAYNNADGVVRLLTSCERLIYPLEKVEFILINDGSTDKTVSLVQNLGFDLDLHLETLAENRGRSAARNAGLLLAKNEIVLFIDSDMETDPDLILYHTRSYDDQTVGVMGDFILPPFVKKNRWFKYLDSNTRGARAWSRTTKNSPGLPYNYIMTANLSVRREAALEIGGFDEEMRHYGGEDMEFAYRLAKADRGVFKFEKLAITFHQHRSFKETLPLLREYGREVLPYLELKHPQIRRKLASRLMRSPTLAEERWGWKVAQLCTAIAIWKPVIYLARAIRLVSPNLIAFPMIKLIMLSHVLYGYGEYTKAYTETIDRNNS